MQRVIINGVNQTGTKRKVITETLLEIKNQNNAFHKNRRTPLPNPLVFTEVWAALSVPERLDFAIRAVE